MMAMASTVSRLFVLCVISSVFIDAAWVPICSKDLRLRVSWEVTRKVADNAPLISYDPNQCTIYVQPCTRINDCENNIPAVTVSLEIPIEFTAVRGSFTEIGNVGANNADDCNGGGPHTAWGQVQDGHGGITLFGTADKILYPGCTAGMNFVSYTFPIDNVEVPTTDKLQFEFHQSVKEEVVLVRLRGIQVQIPDTTTSTLTTTTTATQTTTTATATTETRVPMLEKSLTQLTTELGTMRSDLDALTTRMTSQEQITQAIQTALSTTIANTPPAKTTSSAKPCTSLSQECMPQVSSLGNDLVFKAHAGDINFETRSCGIINPCGIYQDVESIKSALRSL